MSSTPEAPPTEAPQPTPPRSRYGNGTVAGVVLSMLVVGAVVAVLVAIVPRPASIEQPAVDVASSAREIAISSGLPISEPVDLPAGWKATSVRFVASTDNLMTWHIGYLTPDGGYVALEQAAEVTPDWIAAQTNRAREDGEVSINGQTWTRYAVAAREQLSIRLPAEGAGGLTTLVTGKAPIEDLTFFAERLEVVQPD